MSRVAASPGVLQHVAPRNPRTEPMGATSPLAGTPSWSHRSPRSTSSFRGSRRIHSARSAVDEVSGRAPLQRAGSGFARRCGRRGGALPAAARVRVGFRRAQGALRRRDGQAQVCQSAWPPRRRRPHGARLPSRRRRLDPPPLVREPDRAEGWRRGRPLLAEKCPYFMASSGSHTAPLVRPPQSSKVGVGQLQLSPVSCPPPICAVSFWLKISVSSDSVTSVCLLRFSFML